MTKYFEVVTVTEGGADFDRFEEADMIRCYLYSVNLYRSRCRRKDMMTDEEASQFISNLKVGERFDIDGCSHGYVLID